MNLLVPEVTKIMERATYSQHTSDADDYCVVDLFKPFATSISIARSIVL